MRAASLIRLVVSCALLWCATNIAQASLVAHWAFENNLLDSSGNGNHLSVGTGSISYGAPAPTLGTTASFDFDNATRLENTSPTGMGFTAAYTVAAWVKAPLPNASGYDAIFGRGVPFGGDLEIYVQLNTNDMVVVHNRSNAGSINGFTAADPPDDTYYHLAVSYNGSGWTLYYNGVPQTIGTFGTPGLTATAGADAWVGELNHNFFDPNFMNGLVDEMWVYDQVLTQDELDNLIEFNNINGPPVPEPSTLALLGLGAIGLAAKARWRRRAA